MTAAEAIAAIRDAGLQTGEVRDTGDVCPDIGCTARLTTDYVSAYEWPDEETAVEMRDLGPGREYSVVGKVVLYFGGDSDFWPFDTAPYIEAVEASLGSTR